MWHVVLATGQSLLPDPQEVADSIRHLPTVAVSDAYELAPWAQAIVAADEKWWLANPAARERDCEKWLANGQVAGVQRVPRLSLRIGSGSNSGLLGLDYWVRRGVNEVMLLGIDLRGTHYFGPHTKPKLRNTDPTRFETFKGQFAEYAKHMPKDVIVVNCSEISALDCFPKMTLNEALDLAAA